MWTYLLNCRVMLDHVALKKKPHIYIPRKKSNVVESYSKTNVYKKEQREGESNVPEAMFKWPLPVIKYRTSAL